MSTRTDAQRLELVVQAYFEACAISDVGAIAACFAPDAVHYLPHLPPLHGGETIANAIVGDLSNRGGTYFIDRMFTDVERCTVAVEWSRTFHRSDHILRGHQSKVALDEVTRSRHL